MSTQQIWRVRRALLRLCLVVSYAARAAGLGSAENSMAGLQHFESCEQCVAAGLVRTIHFSPSVWCACERGCSLTPAVACPCTGLVPTRLSLWGICKPCVQWHRQRLPSCVQRTCTPVLRSTFPKGLPASCRRTCCLRRRYTFAAGWNDYLRRSPPEWGHLGL